MKKLNPITFNKEKLIPKEDLKYILGGDYGSGYLGCKIDNIICFTCIPLNCSDENIDIVCDRWCPDWKNAICVGG